MPPIMQCGTAASISTVPPIPARALPWSVPGRPDWPAGRAKLVGEEIDARLASPLHDKRPPAAALATLRYAWSHLRCGVYVLIRDGRVKIFAPFCNQDYANGWGASLRLEGDLGVDAYYRRKRERCGGREEFVLKDKSAWWANGNVVCNEHSQEGLPAQLSQLWGDRFLAPLRHMLDEVCATRRVGAPRGTCSGEDRMRRARNARAACSRTVSPAQVLTSEFWSASSRITLGVLARARARVGDRSRTRQKSNPVVNSAVER